MAHIPFDLQLLNLCSALLLLLSFAMLAQRRIVTLVNLLAIQGTLLFAATLLLAWRTGEHHLYLSAALTLALKVVLLPSLLSVISAAPKAARASSNKSSEASTTRRVEVERRKAA